MSTHKPFNHIMLFMQLDYHDGLHLNTDSSMLDTSEYTGPQMNGDDVANRRALYAIAGKLATAGYNVSVCEASDATGGSMYDKVFVPSTEWLSTRDGEQWELDVRQCMEDACKELGLEYTG